MSTMAAARGKGYVSGGADDGVRASVRLTRAKGQGWTRVQGHGRGWIDINDSISGSRSGARGMQDNGDDDKNTINAGGGTEIPKH